MSDRGFSRFSGKAAGVFSKPGMDQIQGQDTPAVAVVVYGNRTYEDALLELRRRAGVWQVHRRRRGRGRCPTFDFPAVASRRPNTADAAEIASFAQALLEKRGWMLPIR